MIHYYYNPRININPSCPVTAGLFNKLNGLTAIEDLEPSLLATERQMKWNKDGKQDLFLRNGRIEYLKGCPKNKKKKNGLERA